MSNKDRFALLNILDAIEKIKRYSEGYADADQLYSDSRSFDAAMMNFIIIGEMVARLSDALTEKNSGIEWFKIKGFRNIIAHGRGFATARAPEGAGKNSRQSRRKRTNEKRGEY